MSPAAPHRKIPLPMTPEEIRSRNTGIRQPENPRLPDPEPFIVSDDLGSPLPSANHETRNISVSSEINNPEARIEQKSINQLVQELEDQLSRSSGANWKVDAYNTDSGYVINVVDVDNDRYLSLPELMKDNQAIEIYTKLIGQLELEAMKRNRELQPGNYNREATIPQLEEEDRKTNRREKMILDKLWSRADKMLESKPETEKKQDKLEKLFTQSKSMLSGLKKGFSSWFQRKRQAAIPSEPAPINKPLIPDNAPVNPVSKNEAQYAPTVNPEQSPTSPPEDHPGIFFGPFEVMREGEEQVEEVIDNPETAHEKLEELIGREAQLVEKINRFNRVLEGEMSSSQREAIETLRKKANAELLKYQLEILNKAA